MARTVTQQQRCGDRMRKKDCGRTDRRNARCTRCEFLSPSSQRPRAGLLPREQFPAATEEHQLVGAVILPLLYRTLRIGKRQTESQPGDMQVRRFGKAWCSKRYACMRRCTVLGVNRKHVSRMGTVVPMGNVASSLMRVPDGRGNDSAKQHRGGQEQVHQGFQLSPGHLPCPQESWVWVVWISCALDLGHSRDAVLPRQLKSRPLPSILLFRHIPHEPSIFSRQATHRHGVGRPRPYSRQRMIFSRGRFLGPSVVLAA
jgi:hypothetical protein